MRFAFLAARAGEWEGITATFSPAGQPQPLPEHYVPEAFREWGVELWDWQSQCSCLAEGADSASTGSRRLRCVWQLCGVRRPVGVLCFRNACRMGDCQGGRACLPKPQHEAGLIDLCRTGHSMVLVVYCKQHAAGEGALTNRAVLCCAVLHPGLLYGA